MQYDVVVCSFHKLHWNPVPKVICKESVSGNFEKHLGLDEVEASH